MTEFKKSSALVKCANAFNPDDYDLDAVYYDEKTEKWEYTVELESDMMITYACEVYVELWHDDLRVSSVDVSELEFHGLEACFSSRDLEYQLIKYGFNE